MGFIPTPRTPICWAKPLGGCSADPRGEHIVSAATIRGPEVGLRGFPFQEGSTYYLPKGQFKSNILCRKHNNELSQVDQAGADAFTAIKTIISSSAPRKSKID